MKKNPLIVGIGEVGKPLYKIVKKVYPKTEFVDLEPKKISNPSIMHICFGYNKSFVKNVIQYINELKPELTLIESTVLPGTTHEIFLKTKQSICHSPVRGRTAEGFTWSLFAYTKYIGPEKKEFGEKAEDYYKSLGFKTYLCHTSIETEFMKILNTTYYGLLISWFQEINRICKEFKIDEYNIVKFMSSTEIESDGIHPRPIFYPSYIGGHCIIPNAKLLAQLYNSKFVDALLTSNELWKKGV